MLAGRMGHGYLRDPKTLRMGQNRDETVQLPVESRRLFAQSAR